MGGLMAASQAGEPAPRKPVITRPDPMTAEEWHAWLDELEDGPDPDEVQDEDDFWYPEADQAELAEVAGADPTGVAAVLAAQVAAASARRRGPGQPGSARRPAGESTGT